jgi:multidrug efflux pump subunit AcrB
LWQTTSRRSAGRCVEIGFSQDKSTSIRQLLSDLQNSVLTAVILVFIVILYALSGRASLLIGFAIPASFLMGILAFVAGRADGQHRGAVQPDPGRGHAGR